MGRNIAWGTQYDCASVSVTLFLAGLFVSYFLNWWRSFFDLFPGTILRVKFFLFVIWGCWSSVVETTIPGSAEWRVTVFLVACSIHCSAITWYQNWQEKSTFVVVCEDYPRLFLRSVYLSHSIFSVARYLTGNSSPSGNNFMKYAYEMLSRIYLVHGQL